MAEAQNRLFDAVDRSLVEADDAFEPWQMQNEGGMHERPRNEAAEAA